MKITKIVVSKALDKVLPVDWKKKEEQTKGQRDFISLEAELIEGENVEDSYTILRKKAEELLNKKE